MIFAFTISYSWNGFLPSMDVDLSALYCSSLIENLPQKLHSLFEKINNEADRSICKTFDFIEEFIQKLKSPGFQE